MVKSVDGVLSNLRINLDTLDQAKRFSLALAKWGETKKAKEGVWGGT